MREVLWVRLHLKMTLEAALGSFLFALFGCAVGAWVSVSIAKKQSRQQAAFFLYEKMEAARLDMKNFAYEAAKTFIPQITLPARVPAFADYQNGRDSFEDLSGRLQRATLLPKAAFRNKAARQALETGLFHLWTLSERCRESFQAGIIGNEDWYAWMTQAQMAEVIEDFGKSYDLLMILVRRAAGLSSPDEVRQTLGHRLQ